MNQEMEAVKQTLQKKADIVQVELLEKKLEEMENRSKRNNIVIWSIPEGAEKDSFCLALVTSILTEHMGLEEIEVMQAHRTSIKQRQSPTSGATLPRPVHVYLLRYTAKEYILRNAAFKLRENPFHQANLYISDDVSKSVREQRKKLKERHLNEIRGREDDQFAYIPWSVPARIIFKLNGESKLKSFYQLQAENANTSLTDYWTWSRIAMLSNILSLLQNCLQYFKMNYLALHLISWIRRPLFVNLFLTNDKIHL